MRKSLTAQTLHYFARPHDAVRRTPVGGAAAWRGEDLAERDDWRAALDGAQVRELERAIAAARRTGRRTEALRREDFPLPTLHRTIARWRRELTDGRGFLVVRGVPVQRWSRRDAELFFWGLGLHLGVPGAQNPEGDLLGHVRDTGEDVREVRRYRTRADIAYHCDAADVVGLLCLRPARRGGLSRIVSSATVHDELLRRHPDLVERLYRPYLLDTHGEGGIDRFPIPPCRHYRGRLRTFWHADYFRSVQEQVDAPPCDAAGRALLEVYDAIAAEPGLRLDMELAPGDVQLLSNHDILHARTAYEDDPDPARKRHLLRLWLSLDRARSLRERAATAAAYARLLATLGRARAHRLRHGPAHRQPA